MGPDYTPYDKCTAWSACGPPVSHLEIDKSGWLLHDRNLVEDQENRSFIGELRRRNVVKVALLYITGTWLLLQLTDVLSSLLAVPEWVGSVVVIFLLLGFFPALLFSWVYELTPEGLRRESELDGDRSIAAGSGQRINTLIVVLLVLSIGGLVADRLIPETTPNVDRPVSVLVPVVGTPLANDVLPNSVAVLPLENLSLDPEDAFFAAGIHDELLNQLAKIRGLNVIARTSVLRYADKGQMSIAEIAKELGVQAVMEGTVRYGGNRVRITAQLIDGASDLHLWSQTYEKEFDVENIFAIESDIAIRIAAALKAELLPTERANIGRLPTTSTEALTQYLRARASITDLGPFMPPDEIANFHRHLDSALLADPKFSVAHAWKAYEYAFSIGRTFRLANTEAVDRRTTLVQKHARAALELDSSLGIAYGALAWTHTWSLHRVEAQAAWDTAYQLSPRDPDIVVDYGYFAAATGQTQVSIDLARRAMAMAPNSAETLAVAGFAFVFAGDYEQAARIERAAIELDPAFFFSYLMLGLVEVARGNDDQALEHLRFAEQLSRGIPSADVMAQIAYGYGRLEQPEDAKRMFMQIEGMATEYHVGTASWALAYLGIGDQQRALEFLWAASDVSHGGEGYLALTYLAGNAFDDPVLRQSKFLQARRNLGLRENL